MINKIVKEIGKLIVVFTLPTLLLIIGILGEKGIQVLSRFEIENAEIYINTAIFGYIIIFIIIIYSYYYEYAKNKDKQLKKEDNIDKSVNEKTSIEEQKDSNNNNSIFDWSEISKKCKNMITIVIIISITRFFSNLQSTFVDIMYFGFLIAMIWCIYKNKK